MSLIEQIQVKNLIAGKRFDSDKKFPVLDKYNVSLLAHAPLATADQVELALETTRKVFENFKKTSAEKRADILREIQKGIRREEETFVELIVKEAGKPVSYARNEIKRALDNLETGIRETLNFSGEMVPMDYLNGKGKTAYTLRVPYGPVLGISPFNFPLNLALHKIIPAIGVGAPVIIKPAPQTPLSMFLLADIIEKSNIPEGIIQIVFTDTSLAEKMLTDDRIKILSFTGSDSVGWYLQGLARRKKVFLEMGGNAAVLIDSPADLNRAAKKLSYGAFLYAGQICISVQRIYAVEEVFEDFKEKFLEETGKIVSGDPSEEDTVNGPMISFKELNRIKEWIEEAVIHGAEILAGGQILDNNHAIFAPTVLTNTHETIKVVSEEIFGPVVILEKVENIAEGIKRINRSRYGLQSSIYSDSLKNIRHFIEEVEAGGVMINEIPGFRIDSMPYGGMKDSGLGREGARYAMREYSQEKLIVIQD